MSHKHSYKGHEFDAETERTDDGRYRARVVLRESAIVVDPSLTPHLEGFS